MTKVSLRKIGLGLVLAAGVTPGLAQRSDPCGALSQYKTGESIPIEDAIACLATVPIDKNNAIQSIAGIKRFLNFQTTVSYLKTPPKSSSQAPLDLIAELDKIANSVNNNQYSNELDFEADVSNLISRAHDGHLSCAFTTSSVISFLSPFAIVSLSKDGTDIPKIYASSDVANLEAGNDGIVSAITKLDDEDVVTYLEKIADLDASQSPDTRWNDLMLTNSRNGYSNVVAAGSFYIRTSYPGKNSIKVTFANGTEVTVPYQASVVQDLSQVTSGEDIYSMYALPRPSGASTTSNTGNVVHPFASLMQGDTMHPGIQRAREQNQNFKRQAQNAGFEPSIFTQTQVEPAPVPTALLSLTNSFFPEPTATESGAPQPTSTSGGSTSGGGGSFPGYEGLSPIVADPAHECAGFYIDDQTAVLVIVAFAPTSDESPKAAPGFQKTIEDFLADCKKTKKTRLIIDVHGNGGGIVGLGFDTLKQLFPSLIPFDAQRFRASDAARIEGEAFSDLDPNNATDATASGFASSLRYQNILQVNGLPYKSFNSFFGPATFNGDKFTNLGQLDLTNPNSYGTPSINITGYNDRSDLAKNPNPFDASNIVLLTDGVCASTCTIFAEILQNQMGVKTVVVGGRPQKGSMAAIGGTRGCQAMTFDGLIQDSNAVINGVGQRSAANTLPLPLPLGVQGGVNYCDQIRNNTKGVPLQFIDEPADCRIYYTAATFMSPNKLWKQVADIMWGNGACAQGSLKGKGSVIGTNGDKPDGSIKSSAAAISFKSSSVALVSGLVAAAVAIVL